MNELATAVRARRRSLGLTLDDLAVAAGCSKAYLSAIENGRLDNPPRPPILEGIERALEATPGELRRLAEWEATPPSVRAQVAAMAQRMQRGDRRSDGALNLDALYASGALAEAADDECGNVERPAVCYQVPLINRVAAGYPRDFTDLDYPARVADEYVSSPDVADPDAFAARVVGESMMPEYREGDIIVFSPMQEPTDGADCFVRLLPDHDTTFKRVYYEADERVRLQPLNPKFAARTVAMDEIDGLYPAVFRMQVILPRAPES